ncbi:MAG: glycosyltransferase [Candidatus Omnitrophica bacterium]|nr:glycosyltransferase [Candidatus Omnitrophota bacterium]
MKEKPDMDKVDIIIVTCNAGDLLRRCLLSVRRHTGVPYLITVVDNGSTDGTPDFLRSQSGLRIISNDKNVGFSRAMNMGIKKTGNGLIVCLDDDVEVTKNWLEGLITCIKRSRVGIVGCKIVFPNGRIHAAEYRIKPRMVVGRGEKDAGHREYVRQVDGLIGPCWLMKREVVKKIGYFDERFYPSQHEDLDFCIRTRLAGFKIIYNGKVKVIHHNLYRDDGLSGENWKKFLIKWKGLRYPFPDTHPADVYNAKGYDYLMAKQFKKALITFKKAAKIDKEFSTPFFIHIAKLLLDKKRGLIKNLLALRRSSHDPFLLSYILGYVFAESGKDKEAIGEYKRALVINPRANDIYYKLGRLYDKLGQKKRARIAYHNALHLSNAQRNDPPKSIDLEIA